MLYIDRLLTSSRLQIPYLINYELHWNQFQKSREFNLSHYELKGRVILKY